MMTKQPIKRMNIKEFRDGGFLQEANRLFFHPLGLALEVVVKCKESPNVADSGEMLLGGIWDYREDPEGVLFGGKLAIDTNKVGQVRRLRDSKIKERIKLGCNEDGVQMIAKEIK